MPKSKPNLTGKIFGRLTVDKESKRNGKTSWICKCDCGNIVNVRADHLTSGAIQSCRCFHREIVSQASKIDLVGEVFGRLTVIKEAGRTKEQNVLWICKCECGNETNPIAAGSLTSGHTQSCGCLKIEITSQTKKLNLIGEIFGRLTVIKEAGRTKKQNVLWICKCECGNETNPITSGHLRSGHTKSCGCWQRESSSQRRKWDLKGEVFGRLTVIKESGKKGGFIMWICKCDCGNETKPITSGHLRSGHTKSCGCLEIDTRYARRGETRSTINSLVDIYGDSIEDPLGTLDNLIKEERAKNIQTSK